jgi:hypothetical protein
LRRVTLQLRLITLWPHRRCGSSASPATWIIVLCAVPLLWIEYLLLRPVSKQPNNWFCLMCVQVSFPHDEHQDEDQSQKVDIDRTDTFVFGVLVENGFEAFLRLGSLTQSPNGGFRDVHSTQ